jgi:hypothetical protein
VCGLVAQCHENGPANGPAAHPPAAPTSELAPARPWPAPTRPEEVVMEMLVLMSVFHSILLLFDS